jgi:uncharacterized protein (TIGR02246 family)
MSEAVIQHWLKEISRTVAKHDHAAHMQLISQDVTLIGVPGFDNIGFDDWSKQCEYEFANRLIERVDYGKIRIRVVTDKRIMFMTYETVTASDGSVNGQGIECLLEKEDDGQWRLIQERILKQDETRQYDLEPAAAIT